MFERLQSLTKSCLSGTVAIMALAMAPSPAQAAGDLLVAPTRIVFDGQRGTEVVLNNIGSETATYRISLGASPDDY